MNVVAVERGGRCDVSAVPAKPGYSCTLTPVISPDVEGARPAAQGEPGPYRPPANDAADPGPAAFVPPGRMPGSTTGETPAAAAEAGTGNRGVTLEQLRALGAALLDTAGIEGLLDILMCEQEVAFENAFHEVIHRRSSDEFKAAAARGKDSPFPWTGTLVRAIFKFWFADSREPVIVELRGRGPALVGSSAHVERVRVWLERIGAGAARGLTRVWLIGLLAGACCGTVMAFDGGDDDDDDGEEQRHALFHRPGGQSGVCRVGSRQYPAAPAAACAAKVKETRGVAKVRTLRLSPRDCQRMSHAKDAKTQRKEADRLPAFAERKKHKRLSSFLDFICPWPVLRRFAIGFPVSFPGFLLSSESNISLPFASLRLCVRLFLLMCGQQSSECVLLHNGVLTGRPSTFNAATFNMAGN